jgi:hypothetical protein
MRARHSGQALLRLKLWQMHPKQNTFWQQGVSAGLVGSPKQIGQVCSLAVRKRSSIADIRDAKLAIFFSQIS